MSIFTTSFELLYLGRRGSIYDENTGGNFFLIEFLLKYDTQKFVKISDSLQSL